MSVPSCYESLVTPHLDDLKKYCIHLTQSKWDGEDLYQEALLRAMVYFLEKEPYPNLKPFLLRVARNLWLDGCRAKQRRKRMPMQALPLYWTDSDYSEVRSLLEWAGERLPRRNLEMLLLSEYFGYSMQEVAEATGSTVPAVKSVLFRTRGLLRKFDPESLRKPGGSKVISLDVERWSRAIMQDVPPSP
ncbi:RNA polymerase sigma factor [Cohnella caldifontis]|uniref:RNA polymerase sigma factor n=1 Tax=Cohnella caldifontis TaxID=3027471 RepID=UPI0023ECA310|nr:RNA polymerase sigma factor [Cohnella sp. YIM B05605]